MSGSRGFLPGGWALEKDVVRLYCEATLDASGDVTAHTRRKGITSLAHGTVGVYTLTLANKYNALLAVNICFEKNGDPGVRYTISSDAVQSAGTITLKFYNYESPAVLVNPLSAEIRIEVIVKNSSI